MAEFDFTYLDVADAVKLIDYAAHEGAYKGIDVMRTVVAKRDKLQRFVEAAEEVMLKAKAESELNNSPQDNDTTEISIGKKIRKKKNSTT